MKKQKYIITGGAGFIGSSIARELVRLGHKVKVIDNLSIGKKANLKDIVAKIDFIKGDICDLKLLEKEFQSFDFVIHQAALKSVPGSFTNPESYNKVNIGGTLNVLRAAAKNKIKKLVFASSSSVYGDSDKFPQKEDFMPRPISPYALTKLAGECYLEIFSRSFNLPAISLRYFNVFGPNQALDDEYALVIPKFINCFLKDTPPPIFGTGQQSRDYIYIDNVVQANLLATENKKVENGVYNVGSGKSQTVLSLVSFLSKITGKNLAPKMLSGREGDVLRTQADISKITKDLGYKILVNYQEGLKRTYDYFKNIS